MREVREKMRERERERERGKGGGNNFKLHRDRGTKEDRYTGKKRM